MLLAAESELIGAVPSTNGKSLVIVVQFSVPPMGISVRRIIVGTLVVEARVDAVPVTVLPKCHRWSPTPCRQGW